MICLVTVAKLQDYEAASDAGHHRAPSQLALALLYCHLPCLAHIFMWQLVDTTLQSHVCWCCFLELSWIKNPRSWKLLAFPKASDRIYIT